MSNLIVFFCILHIYLIFLGRSPSLSPPDNSKDINRKSPLLSNGRSPSQSPDHHLPFVPLNVDHMGLNGLKSTDIKVTYPSVITCGQPLGATNGDLYHRHGYPVGLGLPSSMDSPVVSPISVPVMNDSSRENSQVCFRSRFYQLTWPK